MKILALDLATRTGFALSYGEGVISGSASFKPKRGESHGMILLRFHSWLGEVLEKFQPDIVVYEQAHHRGGAATAIANKLIGKVEELIEERRQAGVNIEIGVYHSATIKKQVLGKAGKGVTKDMMIDKIKRLFPDQNIQDDDQADALALLLTAIRDLSL